MHVEKNICESLLGTLLQIKDQTKDGANARLDTLGGQPTGVQDDGGGEFTLQLRSYNLTKTEVKQFFEFLLSVKTPSSYSTSIKNLVDSDNKKLTHMKSNDCHVMLTQILAVAIRNMMHKQIRDTIIALYDFFNKLWKKVVDPDELDGMQKDIARILSKFDMFFPPLFFDIMFHLSVHLVDEIKLCGPVFLCNIYPFERFMGILKHLCQNRYHPEASIVQGYVSQEVVEFCMEYMKQQPIGVPLSRHEGRLAGYPVLKGPPCH